jgi:uncharacterized protein
MAANLLFIDTSAFYAFFDRKDNNHGQIVKVLQNRTENLITSNYIVDELITLFRFRNLSYEQFYPFVEAIWNEDICNVIRVTADIDIEAWKLMGKFKDHKFSFTDCTSFVLMKIYSITKVCTLDKHFQIMDFENII